MKKHLTIFQKTKNNLLLCVLFLIFVALIGGKKNFISNYLLIKHLFYCATSVRKLYGLALSPPKSEQLRRPTFFKRQFWIKLFRLIREYGHDFSNTLLLKRNPLNLLCVYNTAVIFFTKCSNPLLKMYCVVLFYYCHYHYYYYLN